MKYLYSLFPDISSLEEFLFCKYSLFMTLSHSLLAPPKDVLELNVFNEWKVFYKDKFTECRAYDTRLFDCMDELCRELQALGLELTDQHSRDCKTAAGIFDALAKTRYDSSRWGIYILEEGQPALVIFKDWRLVYANGSYLETGIIGGLKENIWKSVREIMEMNYTQGVIDAFEQAIENPDHAYNKPQYVVMDNNPLSPSYFWHRKIHTDSDGGNIDVRVGMSAGDLSEKQLAENIKIYNLSRKLSQIKDPSIHNNATSYTDTITYFQAEIDAINHTSPPWKQKIKSILQWKVAHLRVANDFLQVSPLAFTVVNPEGKIEKVSLTYVAAVGYEVNTIVNNSEFLSLLYRGKEWQHTDASIKYAIQHGKYISGTDFHGSRGNELELFEENQKISKKIILNPSPHRASDGGFIRLNSTRSE